MAFCHLGTEEISSREDVPSALGPRMAPLGCTDDLEDGFGIRLQVQRVVEDAASGRAGLQQPLDQELAGRRLPDLARAPERVDAGL